MILGAPLLAGLAALGAVPVAIWLLNRNRFKVVRWPALEFLLKTVAKSSRRIQLRELILLILRTAAVVVLALALARPMLADGLHPVGLGDAVQAVVVLDRSLSMGALDGTTSRFIQAQHKAQELIGKLPPGSAAALVLVDDTAQGEVGELSQDLAFVSKAIAAAPLTDGGTSILAGLSKAVDILRPAHGRREIYLLTDRQAVGWPAQDDPAWRRLTDELGRADAPELVLVDVAPGAATADLQVERFAPVDALVSNDGPTTFAVLLHNRGPQPAPGVAVELWSDGPGSDLRKCATAVSPRIDTTAEVHLDARLEPGLRRVQVRITPDGLAADDRRQMVVQVGDRLRILVVDGGGGASGDGSGFLRAALDPAGAVPGATAPFQVDVLPAAQFASADLAPYQVVILNDVPAPVPAVGTALRAWVASGRGLLLLPGQRAVAQTWNAALATLVPATLGPAAKDFTDPAGQRGQGLSTTRLIHPIVDVFAAADTQPFLAQPRFWRGWPLTPVAEATVIVPFSDGQPALVERTVGRGAVVMAAFPSDKTWTDLPLRPAFLMLLQRTVQHLALGHQPTRNVRVHEPLRLAVPAALAGTRITAIDPKGEISVLNPTSAADGTATVELTDTPLAGFYRIASGERSWWFAVNPPVEESDLTTLDHPAIAARLQPAPVTWIGDESPFGAARDRARSGFELWPWLFAVAVACLIAETLLVVRWTPRGT